MKLDEFCAAIGLNAEAANLAAEFPMAEEEYQAYAALFARDHQAFSAEVRKRADAGQAFLYLFVHLAMDCYPAYCRRGIPDRIYYDTFRDIAIWAEEYRQETGQAGLGEDCWLWLHPQLRIFRLGRLQFQPCAMPRELLLPERRIWQGEPVLDVHIPKDGPLDPDAVQDSYRQAGEFFRGFSPVFLCESWLLCPELPRLLRADSNILKFQAGYRLYGIEPNSRQAEERIFGRLCSDPSEYPETTSLQRAAKRHLEAGGKLESGRGVRLTVI